MFSHFSDDFPKSDVSHNLQKASDNYTFAQTAVQSYQCHCYSWTKDRYNFILPPKLLNCNYQKWFCIKQFGYFPLVYLHFVKVRIQVTSLQNIFIIRTGNSPHILPPLLKTAPDHHRLRALDFLDFECSRLVSSLLPMEIDHLVLTKPV